VVVVVVVVMIVVVVTPIVIVPMLELDATDLALVLLVTQFTSLVAHPLFVAQVLVVPPFSSMMRMVSRRVHVSVPAIRHEIHGPATSIVFAAVPRPMTLVPSRDVQVHRYRRSGADDDRGRHSHYGARENQLRRRRHRHFSANRELAINAWRGDIQRETDITRERRGLHCECPGSARERANEPMRESGLHTASARLIRSGRAPVGLDNDVTVFHRNRATRVVVHVHVLMLAVEYVLDIVPSS